MRQVIQLLIITVAVTVPMRAMAQTETYPEPKANTFVYTIPGNFVPPNIGNQGMKDLQVKLAGLHHPYYVILVQQLPGSGDGDARAASFVNNLANAWSTRSPVFTPTSSIFVLSYEPRKFRFLAGARWTNEFGFANAAHAPYTALFEKSVKKNPPDLLGGIWGMAAAVDEHLFDLSDPERVRQRKEEEDKRQKAKALVDARDALHLEVNRLEQLLLHAESTDLPSSAEEARTKLGKAKLLLDIGKPELDVGILRRATEQLQETTNGVEQHLEKKANEKFQTKALFISQILAILLACGYGIWHLMQRFNRWQKAKRDFQEAFDDWNDKVNNGLVRCGTFQTGREEVSELGNDLEGASRNLYKKVTETVDDITIGLQALGSHLSDVKKQAGRASFFRIARLTAATEALEEPFSFDTGSVEQASLFSPLQHVTTIRPREFAQGLEKRFREAIQGWNELRAARKSQLEPIKLEDAGLPALKTDMERYGIPLERLEGHPLRAETAEQGTLRELENLQLHDPLAFAKRLQELDGKMDEARKRVQELLAVVKPAGTARPSAFDLPEGTIFDEDDHPDALIVLGDKEHGELLGLLATDAHIDEIRRKAAKVVELYKKATQQAESIRYAVREAQGTLAVGRQLEQTALGNRTEAQNAETLAQRVHKNVDVQGYLGEGNDLLKKGQDRLRLAEHALKEKRHLDARRRADDAVAHLEQAIGKFNRAKQRCGELNRLKQDYESLQASLGNKHADAERRIRNVGGSPSLRQPQTQPTVSGPTDYGMLYGALKSQTDAWEQQASQAEAEAAEARRRAEQRRRDEEAQRRREEEDARRRREDEERTRNSYYSNSGSSSSYSSSSSSSSSGGSWGGGGGSDSGGSWGGGGDSSSGGSW